jgi:outer membrane beta-barrel protein
MKLHSIAFSLLVFFASATSLAADKADKKVKTEAATTTETEVTTSPTGAEKVNVENIKEKYWARGDEQELGVVQNRAYSKSHKIEVSLVGGVISSDPFLSTQVYGMTLGYHFSEYLNLHLLGWKEVVNTSNAFTSYQNSIKAKGGVPAIPATNNPNWYLGPEVSWSVLYGKLSVLGKSIVYYDLHLLGGVGITNTFDGSEFTPSIGVGQQIYLSRVISIAVDYRMMIYGENIYTLDGSPTQNVPTGSRTNYTNAITLGVQFLIGAEKK